MKKTLTLGCCISLLVFLFACRKNKPDFEGPSIQELYSDFKLMQAFKANRDSVNFTQGETVQFSATFNKVVDWTIHIVGKKSHGVKRISGVSKQIDATNGVWDGSVSDFPMFMQEDCSVMLTINQVADTFRLNEKIIGTKPLNGFMVADFEAGLKPGWVRFAQTGANMDFQIKTDTLAPQGGKYFNMAGTVNWDWLIGLIDYPASAYGSIKTFPLSSNADAVYFNCLIYGVPNTNPTLVLFQFKEDENGDGVINANTDDQYDFQVNVDWVGWKLVSVKYKDVQTLVNGVPSTPKGNGIHNPDKIGKISMLHLANPNDGFASSKIDLLMFTENSALQP
ncbi:MAG: hypothetical protein ACR2IL_00900 [Chitinophagaceae bacterium]